MFLLPAPTWPAAHYSGGPIGLAASIIDEISKTQTGNTIGGNMLTLLTGNSGTQTAQNADANVAPYMSANQRAAYNAYVSSSRATQSGGTGSITA